MIPDYVRRLADALPLSGPARDRVLSEVEDHLRDATESRLASGLSRGEAEEMAVRHFGEPSDIAGAFARGADTNARIVRMGGRMIELELVGIRIGTPDAGPPPADWLQSAISTLPEGLRESLRAGEAAGGTPAVVLRDPTGGRLFPIWIGAVEATAIAFAQQAVKTPRPMSHDFLVNLLSALGDVEAQSLVITRVEGGTYFAELRLRHAGADLVVDCRPSDGIAVAVRLRIPIFANEELTEHFVPAA